MEKSISLGQRRFQGKLSLLEGVDEGKPPIPTAGMQAITAICSQAGDLVKTAASFRPSGLGHVVQGNNAAMPPPSQRINGNNAGELAALAKALEGIDSKGKSEANPRETKPQKQKEKPADQPAAPQPTPVKAPPEEHPLITLPEVKVDGDAQPKVKPIVLDPVVIKGEAKNPASGGIF